MHEASLHEFNSFVTLTYNDEHLPPGRSLRHKDFSDFCKRLLSFLVRQWRKLPEPRGDKPRFSFYMCGEYGPENLRPHYHALLFGVGFFDRKVWKKSPSGSLLYRSARLEQLWPLGHSSIGDVSAESASYVARYCHKKVGSDFRKDLERVDDTTGEVYEVCPEYSRMSLRPAVALNWFNRFASDVFPADRVVFEGKEVPVPRYYLNQLKRHPWVWHEVVGERAELSAAARSVDGTAERLLVREAVLRAKFSRKRSL